MIFEKVEKVWFLVVFEENKHFRWFLFFLQWKTQDFEWFSIFTSSGPHDFWKKNGRYDFCSFWKKVKKVSFLMIFVFLWGGTTWFWMISEKNEKYDFLWFLEKNEKNIIFNFLFFYNGWQHDFGRFSFFRKGISWFLEKGGKSMNFCVFWKKVFFLVIFAKVKKYHFRWFLFFFENSMIFW